VSGNSQKLKYEQAQAASIAAGIHVGALVKVVAFYPDSMTVDVQPIAQRLTGGEYATPSQVIGVPVAGTRGGGFIFRPWYKNGDIGAVLYLDHDIDTPLEKGADCKPNTERCHSDSDAVFIGGIVAGGWVSQGLPEGLVMATEDGSVYLAVTPGGIQIQGDVTVTGGDVVADGISLKQHKHPGVQAGGGMSDKPI